VDERPSGPRPDRVAELTPEQAERIEQLNRELQVYRRRDDQAQIKRILEEMREISPNSSPVWEALGDEAAAAKDYKAARDAYKRAFESDELNKSAERKHADMVAAIELPGIELPTGGDFEAASNGMVGVLLSAFLPGLGQVVTGFPQKGGAMIAIYLVAWFFVFLIPNGIAGLMALVGISKGSPFNGLVLVPLLVAMVTWIVSLADASTTAKKYQSHKRIDRPIPPVDKEFEI
jgi:hypothetical protein